MVSGWLQMMETEVSFLSSTNRSKGALVGSAEAVTIWNYSADIAQVAQMHQKSSEDTLQSWRCVQLFNLNAVINTEVQMMKWRPHRSKMMRWGE